VVTFQQCHHYAFISRIGLFSTILAFYWWIIMQVCSFIYFCSSWTLIFLELLGKIPIFVKFLHL
jgi:hypothetical protein